MRILIVEDDRRAADFLQRGLSESGHIVDQAGDGETGLALAAEGIYEILVVDRLLPKLNGLALVSRLRAAGHGVPVLMLSAIAGMCDRVAGLQAGCDDYMAKPYAFAELLARIEMLARRADRSRRQNILRARDLELDVTARRASRGGRVIDLQRREFLLLELRMRHVGQIVTRDVLLEAAWDYRFEARGNIVDMHIHRLRRKVDGSGEVPLIRTVPGAGYMIQEHHGPLHGG